MAYFTKDKVHRLAEAIGIQTRSMLNESVEQQFRNFSIRTPIPSARDESKRAVGTKTFDIFLSHSSLDAPLVLALYTILTTRGYKVYLDRIHDRSLNRQNVTRKTAEIIRRRMTQCDSLFVATTSNTIKSQWVPWELGFADGLTGKSAILPIVQYSDSTFNGSSYFELYPTVGERTGSSKPNDMEITEKNRNVSPCRWIHNAKTY